MRGPKPLKLTVGYVLMLVAAVAVFLVIRAYGEALPAPALAAGTAAPATGAKVEATFHLLLTLALVIVLGRVFGRLFAYVGQPPVIGEVVAGIVLGPSVLGQIVPDGPAMLLPPTVAPYLREIGQLGVILYMFVVGLELNASRLREQAAATAVIAHAGIAVPFVLGGGLAVLLYPRLAPAGVPFTSFALFLGVAMAITAFPVLARILTDRKMTRTAVGGLALACAAIGDVTAWGLLAGVVGVARADLHGAAVVALGALAFLAVMFLVVRPVLHRLAARYQGDTLPGGVAAGVLVAVLLAALTTDAIGIHPLFGAFLLGAIIPHDSAIARVLGRKLVDVVTVLFLPAFFAFAGMRTEIGLVEGLEGWLICGLIILVATAGKFGGTLAAAWATGLDWWTSAALGTLMNTRGLMELIVLNVGLDLGVISPPLFAMMVLMALVTTVATSPILYVLVPDLRAAREPADAAVAVGGP